MSTRHAWAEAIEAIRGDRRSGATALAGRAAEALTLLLDEPGEPGPDTLEAWRAATRELAACRPPIASLFALADQVARLATTGSPADAPPRDLARSFAGVLRQRADLIAGQALPLLDGPRRVLTISASSMVERSLVEAHRRGGPLKVVCLESRPGREGVALAAALDGMGIEVRVAVDAAAARLVDESDLVLVGGDTVCPRGLIHKLGTYPLALAAREARVPLYALAGLEKWLPAPVRGWEQDGGPPGEVLDDPADPDLPAWNGYFDLTPLDLLAGVVDEDAVHTPAEAAHRAASIVVHEWLQDLLATSSTHGSHPG